MAHGSRGAAVVLVAAVGVLNGAGPADACSPVATPTAAEVIAFARDNGANNLAVVEYEVIAEAPALMPLLGPRSVMVATRAWGDAPDDALRRAGEPLKVPYLKVPWGSTCGQGSDLNVGQRFHRFARVDPTVPLFAVDDPWVLEVDRLHYAPAVDDDRLLTAEFGAPRVFGVSFWTRAIATVSLLWPHVAVFLGFVAFITWIIVRRRRRPPAPSWRPSAGHETRPA